jgi:DNA-binding NarL/FixJ family response regulator
MRKMKKLALVDDHHMLRTGLRAFLEQNSDWRVSHEAATASDAMRLFDESPDDLPEAAIIDISLPDMDGIALIRRLHEQSPETAFVVYSMHVTAGYIRSALSAGARAYVSKSSPCTDVLSALEAVMNGTLFLDSVSLAIQLSQYTGDKAGPILQGGAIAAATRRSELTFQEDRVFLLAAKNMTNAEIADELGIRVKTVENYISIIYQKLNVKNRFELLNFARDSGLA